jgi:Yip1 domain
MASLLQCQHSTIQEAMMTPEEIEAAPAEAPVKKRGLAALLLGIVLWPRSTFAYMREDGGPSWILPVLLVALLVVAIPIEKAQADAAIAAMQAQLAAQGQDTSGKGTFFISGGPGALAGLPGASDPAANPLLAYGLPVVGVVWDWLFRGTVLLGLAWVLGGRPGAGAMFRMSGWTLLPNAARLAVALAVMLVAHHEPLAGLEGFGAGPANANISVNSDSGQASGGGVSVQIGPGGKGGLAGLAFLPLLRSSLLSAIDLYTFWSLLLMAIGVAVTARLGWLKSALSTAGYWVLSLVLATLPPLLSFMLLTLARPGGIVSP